MNLPAAKNRNLVVQHLNGEVLVYDLITHQAFCLNDTSAKVFNHCDGKTSFDELKRQYNFTDDLIYFTLDKLKENNLIEDYQSNYFGNLSRREVIRKVGLASMIALPLVSTLVAPTAAMAQSVSCIPNGSPSSASAPNTGNAFLDQAICITNAAAKCCNNGTDGFIGTYNGTTNPVTCTVTCGNVPVTF